MTNVDLVTGFLGAGKTTFISRYSKWLEKNDINFEIIENEFGIAGIDTTLLKDTGIKANELAGGCICCSLKTDFAKMLIELSKRTDRIIVEPSGIFSLDEFYSVMKAPDVAELCKVGAVITIVDPASLSSLGENALTVLASQLHSTGRIILSKTASMTKEEVEDSAALLMELGSAMCMAEGGLWKHEMRPKLFTKEWAELTDADFKEIAASLPLFFTHKSLNIIDHQRVFNSVTVYTRTQFGMDGIKLAVSSLESLKDSRVLRIKGYVLAQNGGSYIINYTPGKTDIRYSPEVYRPILNIIGIGLEHNACEAAFHSKA